MTVFALTSDLHFGASSGTARILEKFTQKLEADQSWQVLLIAGDLSITKPEQMQSLFKLLRRYISRPIVVVRGNHDFWSEPRRSVDILNKMHERYFKEFNIHHLENNPYITEDGVTVLGWDGWYTHGIYARGTNDHNWMPSGSEEILAEKSQDDMGIINLALMGLENTPTVLMNHMPIIGGVGSYRHAPTTVDWLWESVVKAGVRAYCYGHVHQSAQRELDGVRVYSAEVDYNAPGYLTFEVTK